MNFQYSRVAFKAYGQCVTTMRAILPAAVMCLLLMIAGIASNMENPTKLSDSIKHGQNSIWGKVGIGIKKVSEISERARTKEPWLREIQAKIRGVL